MDIRIQLHHGQGARLAAELESHLLKVITVDVGVAGRMHKLSGLQAAHLRYHEREQGVGGNVEGNAQEHVCAALIQLAGKLAIGHVELEKAMAGRKRHFVHLRGVPGAHQHTARIRITADGFHHLRELVYAAAVRGGPGAPLVPVDGAQIAVGIGPFVPDGDAVVLEELHIGISGDEPQELIDDGLEVHLLGGEQREALGQIEAHLIAEYALGARPGAVFLHDAVGADMS